VADPNIELEELTRLTAQFNEELRTLGYVTDQTARAMALGSTKNAKQLEQAGEKAVDALFDLAGSVTGAARAMAQGEKGAAAFNSSLDQLTSGVISVVTVLGLLVPLGRALKPLGGALSALGINVGKVASGAAVMTAGVAGAALAAKGFTDIMKAANEQADRLYKSYSGLAKSGAAASDGLTGVFEDAKRLGIAVTELDGMVQVIAQNATELTLFGGGVAKGRQQLASMGKSLEGSREYFLRLGYDMTEVTGVMADYVQQQRLIGNTTVNSAADLERLSQGAQRYLEQQDALTKLTGMARQEQEKAREQVRSQERFAAQLERLRQQGKTKEAEELEKTYLILHSQNKEAAQGFADIQTGNVQTEAAQKSLMGSQGESLRAAQQVIAGQIGAAEAAQRIASAHGETATRLGTTMGLIGTYNQVHGDLAGDLRLRGLAEKDIVKILAEIEEDQKKLKDQQGKGVDKQLVDQARLRETQIRANEAMERFVSDVGLPAATAAAQAFADGLIYGKDKLYELFGEKPPARSEKTPPPPTPMPAQASTPVKPRPSDPLKAQIWDSNYASGWNPDGTPKSKSDRPAPAPAPAAPAPAAPAPAPAAPAPASPRPAQRRRDEQPSTPPQGAASTPFPIAPSAQLIKDLESQPPGRPPAVAPSPAPIKPRRKRSSVPVDPDQNRSTDRPDSDTVSSSPGTVNIPVTASPAAFDFIKNKEGFHAKAYRDRTQWSIGYGTRTDDPDEIAGKKLIDEKEAEKRMYDFVRDRGVERAVAKYAKQYKWTQSQFDALVSFAYNAGPGAVDQVTDRGRRDNKQISEAMMLYVKARKDPKKAAYPGEMEVLPGLVERRKHEQAMFNQELPMMARGGITKGISIAGEAGPEAVVPLPDGRTIPVELTSGVSLLSDEQLSRLYPRTDPKEKDATMRDYAVSDLAREEMSRPENIAKQIDLLNLIANSPIVDPTVTSTVDNSIMFAEGGITKGISIAGEAGPEAVVPLPDGRTIPVTIKLSDAAAMGQGAFGENEYTGVNLGPITTDLAALKQIAGSLGAYDAATETITDPRTWKEILNTGMLMNFDMAGARFGTKMFGPDIGLEIGTAVKEVMATGDTDVAAALREVRDQFREAMAQVVDAMKDKDSDTQQRMLETLQNIAALQGRTADASQKMARLAAN
jgi:GH24 family phage-related lysozyme (muramidase)